MWFKNLRVFQLTEAFTLSPETLDEHLAPMAFQPCGKLDPLKYGWVPPLGREGQQYVHASGGAIMLCAKRQEKVLPSAVIKEALEDKVAEIGRAESRHVGRAERQSLKDEVIFTLLPRALAKSALDYAYVDTLRRWLVVNTASAGRAEELLSALREATGSLKALPLTPLRNPREVMTGWLLGEDLPKELSLGEECELQSLKDGRVIRCKNHDLSCDEVRQHIDSGLQVTKIALCWKEAITCVVDEQLGLKRLKYDDAITEKAEHSTDQSMAEQFDREFSVMTLELAAFLACMIKAFGGVETEHPL